MTKRNSVKRRFRAVFRYYLRSIMYARPALLGWVRRMIGHVSAHRDPAYWDSKLAGAFASYLGGVVSVDAESAVIATVIRHTIPRVRSFLDVGCAAGSLALALSRKGIERYVGVDISEYAVRKAKKEVLKDKEIQDVSFHVCDLCDFSPESSSAFDVIVFGEVLYYLDVEEVVVQLERYSNWLRPNGVFCISMRDEPKARAIYRAISKRFQPVYGILFQASPHRVRFRIFISREHPAFLIGVFRPTGSL